MAKPIKNTPVLKGQDAINFFDSINANKDKKVARQQLAAIQQSAQQLKTILKAD